MLILDRGIWTKLEGSDPAAWSRVSLWMIGVKGPGEGREEGDKRVEERARRG